MNKPPKEIKLMIIGKMGTGKSTVVDYLVEQHQAMRFTRSNLMKRVCYSLVDGIGSLDDYLDRLYPEDTDIQDELREKLFQYIANYEPEPGKPRRLFQEVTDIVMEANPLVYDLELSHRINQMKPLIAQPFYLIDDVRSLEAYNFYHEQGYKTLRVQAALDIRRLRMLRRDGHLPSPETFNHPSEIELDQVKHDFLLENNDNNTENIYASIDKLIKNLREGAN